MLKIKELKNALKEINIGDSFSRFMPRAYYNMDDDTIIVCDLEKMMDFNNRYLEGSLDDDYINGTIERKALSEIYPNFFFIDCYISKMDLINSFIKKVEDKTIRDNLDDAFFQQNKFSLFKKELLKNNLFKKYLAYIDEYYEETAILWCKENSIDYCKE